MKKKVQVNLTIDYNILKYHKSAGTNISRKCEDYLKALMGSSSDKVLKNKQLIDSLKDQLAKAEAEQAAYAAAKKVKHERLLKEDFKGEIQKLQRLNKRKQECNAIAKKEFAELFEKIVVNYGLSRAETLAYVEGKVIE